MSESKKGNFKKRAWGCPDPLNSLGSKQSVSKPVVDCVSDVQVFKSSDASPQHGVSNIANVVCDDFVKVNSGATQVGGDNSINTRYFYSTAVDKKCVQGLLARGKKATVVAKQFERPIKVNTRVFVPSFEPKSPTTTAFTHTTPTNQVVPVSVNGVSPPSRVVGPKPFRPETRSISLHYPELGVRNCALSTLVDRPWPCIHFTAMIPCSSIKLIQHG